MIHFNDRSYKDAVLLYCYETTGIKNQPDVVEYATENGLLNNLGHLTYSGLTLAGTLKKIPSSLF